MPKFEPVPSSFSNPEGKVVVLTGGAHGVGEAVIRYLCATGAHTFFGDIDKQACQALVDGLEAERFSSGSLDYLHVDVSKYEDNLALFKLAYERHGRVDHAFSIAGVTERQNWFEPSLDLKSVEIAPSTTVLDVNLTGLCYFARIATVYLRQGNDGHKQDKSICLSGSIASFKEQAGLFIYQPSKHGVIGLMRSTRKMLYHEPFVGSLMGLAIYVEGGKGWEIEKDLDNAEVHWLGEENAKIEEALGLELDSKQMTATRCLSSL
ncbi:hypothetical protein PV05_08006 [Exophiala xenobiotica]|uniref:Uncharacterized protein n=1 Tax=Exophiala xenobiotica TaxID=348802 RepID=A0A0D2EX18_9EURO|nr:uncharacterized protein PV05_08006 [Exophiala xenobiotica]KIW52364.1 hypothetical protein PV05_08006 [Exophiala xenobiotica]